MSTDTNYTTHHMTPDFSKKELDEEQHRETARKETMSVVVWIQIVRFTLIFLMFVLILTVFSTLPFMDNVRSDFDSNTYDKLIESTLLIRSNPQATDQLPIGYWVNENRTTDRVLCIQSWSGAWMTCSLSYGHNFTANFRWEPSWLSSPTGLTFLTITLAMILGALFTIIIPWKYSILWNICKTA